MDRTIQQMCLTKYRRKKTKKQTDYFWTEYTAEYKNRFKEYIANKSPGSARINGIIRNVGSPGNNFTNLNEKTIQSGCLGSHFTLEF
ncbi:hypothetical protein Bhyg_05513 [Pseudolycoriella hygida]|uniref:Uncharacterized protein n=1 Tax=Pseudolycoriella hygida TaxID=35572 RepID=A0A9Q0MYU3_9DIPT|nr:hypothetical protein Bhyg_05513 [Pseudolycoriella hygida]